MKMFSRLPLYLGIGVLVLAVLVSTKKISDDRSLSNSPKASQSGAILNMKDDGEGRVSVFLTSDREIAGVDVVVKFDKNKVEILPSTLTSGSSFITSGGVADNDNGLFSFTAVVKEEWRVKTGVVATFQLEAIVAGEVDLQFAEGLGNTAVIEKTSGNDILTKKAGVKFNLPVK